MKKNKNPGPITFITNYFKNEKKERKILLRLSQPILENNKIKIKRTTQLQIYSSPCPKAQKNSICTDSETGGNKARGKTNNAQKALRKNQLYSRAGKDASIIHRVREYYGK